MKSVYEGVTEMQYNYLIVGAGLFGAVFAHKTQLAGKKVMS